MQVKINKILLTLILTMFVSTGVFASNGDIKVTIDGVKLNTDVNPVITSNRTMVPVRPIFEALGGKVEWDQDTRTATITKDSDTIKLQIGSKKAYINGGEFLLDVPVREVYERTLVPVRFVAESLGCGVYWDHQNKIVAIETSSTDEKFFEFNKEEGKITGYSDTAPKHVIIPSTINGVTVEGISKSAFYKKSLNSVTMPKGITSIGPNAFRENKLTSVIIPKGVKIIGHHAFTGNLLTSLTIPEGVTSIEGYAFSGNKLTTVKIPEGITSISESTFVLNDLSAVEIPKGVTSIGYGAFAANKIVVLILPDGVTDIDVTAFDQNLLTLVIIPKGITNIYKDAFRYQVEFIKKST